MPFMCNACDQVIDSSLEIREHVAGHLGLNCLCECYYCHGIGRVFHFQNYVNLAQHSTEKHQNQPCKAVCVRSLEDDRKLYDFFAEHVTKIERQLVTKQDARVETVDLTNDGDSLEDQDGEIEEQTTRSTRSSRKVTQKADRLSPKRTPRQSVCSANRRHGGRRLAANYHHADEPSSSRRPSSRKLSRASYEPTPKRQRVSLVKLQGDVSSLATKSSSGNKNYPKSALSSGSSGQNKHTFGTKDYEQKFVAAVRGVRFGSYHTKNIVPLKIDARKIKLDIIDDKKNSNDSIISFLLAFRQVVKIQYHISNNLGVLFINVSDYCATKMRNALRMVDDIHVALANGLPYFDPKSDHCCHKFLTVLLELPPDVNAFRLGFLRFFEKTVEPKRVELLQKAGLPLIDYISYGYANELLNSVCPQGYCAMPCNSSIDSAPCTICLEPKLPRDNLTTLHCCRNDFHTKCIRKWLTQNSVCPLCKKHTLMKE